MTAPTLTVEQRDVVTLGDGAYLVTAPPGSGKTEVLVQRVIHLLNRSPGDLFRILALTYTVKAARELDDRVRLLVPDRDRWRVNATTFHSFGLGILQNYGKPVGLAPPVTVISDIADKRLLVEPLVLPHPADPFTPSVQADRDEWLKLFAEIARRKINLEEPDQVENMPMLNGQVTLRSAYEAYESALAVNGCVDYEGMIYQTVRLLGFDPWVASHIRRQYRHILVDEGQELTRGQYQLLKAIGGDKTLNVLVAADTDQSINAHAGGGPAYLERFVSDFHSEERRLTTNFRSAALIIDSLNSLRLRIATDARPLQTGDGNLAPGWVAARSYANEDSEARAISDWICLLLKEGLDPAWLYEGEATDIEPHNVGLLGRTRYTFNAVVTELAARDVPVVQRIEQGALFESQLGRSGYEVLKLMENPRDLPARRRLVEQFGGRCPPGSDHGSHSEGSQPILQTLADDGLLPHEFANAFTPSSDASADGLRAVTRLIDLDLTLAEDEMGAWRRDQELLRQWLAEYQVSTSSASRSLSGLLRMLARLSEAPLSRQAVHALTPHRARGLGFKVVVVLGMNEGTLPYYRATSPDELDEERRVVYVAASRAARALLLTRARQRRSRYGNWYDCRASRFIGEMGLDMEDMP